MNKTKIIAHMESQGRGEKEAIEENGSMSFHLVLEKSFLNEILCQSSSGYVKCEME